MLNRIRALFAEPEASQTASRRDIDEKHLAAAALLVEAARMDSHFDDAEAAAIERLLGDRFQLTADEVATLIKEAKDSQAETNQLVHFTQTVKDRFDHDERIEMIEMLWEVAYADGELHDYEANLLRRIGGLLYVSDRERGDARKRVIDRLGLEAPTGR